MSTAKIAPRARELESAPLVLDTDDDGSGTDAIAPFRQLFHFAEPVDLLLLLIGCLASTAAGVCIPFTVFLMSRALDVAGSAQGGGFNATAMQFNALAQIITGQLIGLFALISTVTAEAVRHRQMARFRKAHLCALLRQEKAWHDGHNPFELPVRSAELLAQIDEGG